MTPSAARRKGQRRKPKVLYGLNELLAVTDGAEEYSHEFVHSPASR
jgi:hypothetical protein